MLTTRGWFRFGCGLGIAVIFGGFCWIVYGMVETAEDIHRLGAAVTPEDLEEVETGVTSGIAVAALGGLLLTICVLKLKSLRKEEWERTLMEEEEEFRAHFEEAEITPSEEPPPLRPRDGGP